MKKTIIIRDEYLRGRAIKLIQDLPLDHQIRISPADARTLEQNSKMWPMLNDIAKQVIWHGMKLTAKNWKDMITAALKKQTVVPGLDGGFVALGAKTSEMSKKEMMDVITYAYAFGNEKNVKWSEPIHEDPVTALYR